MKAWTIIQNEREYNAVVTRIEELSKKPPLINSEEGKELLLLGYLADRYEEEAFPLIYPNPIEAIKIRMNDLGLAVADLLSIFGDRGTASKVLNGERALSLNMIRGLSERLSLPADLLIRPLKPTLEKMSQVKEKKMTYKKLRRANNR